MRKGHADEAVLITTAPVNIDEEFDHRKKKYAIMMGLRAVCVLVAALTYQYSMFVALACVVGGAVLPWCAVIIANDRPPRRSTERPQYGLANTERALPATATATEYRVVDG
jgi:tRNA uridine 5-carbamoylmethylation protein Kti12